jgi:hypothetical protein
MYWDRFDICHAYFMFAMLFHGGQWGDIYATFGKLDRIKFHPSPLLSHPSQLNGNAKEIYMNLVRKHIGVHSTINHA